MGAGISEIGETDAYILAMERTLTGRQGRHVCCSVLELAQRPDVARLRAGLAECLRRHPMLTCRIARPFPWKQLWYVKSPRPAPEVPLAVWREEGPVLSGMEDAQPCVSAEALLHEVLNDPRPFTQQGDCRLRLDVIGRRDGSWWLVMFWHHTVLDGVGAEWLLQEIAALAADPEAASVAPSVEPPARSALPSAYARWQACWPMLNHLMEILKTGIFSLAGKTRHSGGTDFAVTQLSAEQSARARERCAAVCGPLLPMAWHLACAVRAHDAVWRKYRGGPPPQYVVALPVQDRPRGRPGPIFRNNASVIFFTIPCTLAEDTAGMVKTIFAQQREALKQKLVPSFLEMQRWMKPLPSRLYSFFLGKQMKGQTTAFHHSYTGVFAPKLESMAGVPVGNAFHIPILYAPPGTGVFISERNGCYTVTTTWRRSVLDAEDAALLRQAFVDALCGEDTDCHQTEKIC